MEVYQITVWSNACNHTPITVVNLRQNSKLLIFVDYPFCRFLTSNVTICRFVVAIYTTWKFDKALWYFREKWKHTSASDRSNSTFFSVEDWSDTFHRCEPVANIDANQSHRSLRIPLRRNEVHQLCTRSVTLCPSAIDYYYQKYRDISQWFSHLCNRIW